MKWLRPRADVFPVVRIRAPLTVLLYQAAREGRLLWHGDEAFAVWEFPRTQRSEDAERSPGLSFLDQAWGPLHLVGVATVVGLVVGLGPRFLTSPQALWVAIVLLATFFAALAIWVVHLIRSSVRLAMPTPAALRARILTTNLRGAHPSLILCHLSDHAAADGLRGSIESRIPPDGVLAVFERGVTTPNALETVRASSLVRQHIAVPAVLILAAEPVPPVPMPSTPLSWYRLGRYFSLGTMVVALGLFLAFFARIASDVESWYCTGSTCDDRPATYGRALYWLVNRLFGGDPEGIGATTTPVRILGILTSVGGVVVIGVFLGSIVTAATRRLAVPAVADVKPDPEAADQSPGQADQPPEATDPSPDAGDLPQSRVVTSGQPGLAPAGVALAVTVAVAMALGAAVQRRLSDRS